MKEKVKHLKKLLHLKNNQNPIVLKYLITGLGNIGQEYENTRHNIGFTILDALAGASNIHFKEKRYGAVAELKYKSRILILLKPNTFMNLSGKAVNYWLQAEKIKESNMLVLSDDVALDFGRVRIRPKGGAGGHNGLGNINTVLGHSNYARLRFGVGNDFHPGQQVNYVLGKWSDEEIKLLQPRIELCHDIIKGFCTLGLERTMTMYNNK